MRAFNSSHGHIRTTSLPDIKHFSSSFDGSIATNSGRCVSSTGRRSDLPLFPPREHRIKTPRAWADKRKVEKQEAIKHGRHSIIHGREDRLGMMYEEIGERHFPGEQECDRPGEEAEEDSQPSEG